MKHFARHPRWAAVRHALACTALLAALAVSPASAETFRYRFADGDSYRINSTVHENVFVNRRFSHTAEITNRITVSVSDLATGGQDAPGETSARHDCTFMTSERNTNRSFSWGREYGSSFRRNALGQYDISDEYFMPVVRNVPTFPGRDVKPGESWTGTGEEAHDLRDSFGIPTPFRVPFTVTYTYEGPVERGGKTLHLIRAEYTLVFDSPERPAKGGAAGGAAAAAGGGGAGASRTAGDGLSGDWPVTTLGYSKQKLYWDNELGMLQDYSEEFRIQLQLASGTVLDFRGTAEATVTETKLLDRDRVAADLNDEIARLGIADARAEATDEGITISLENIQFEADSARLLPSEKEKITKIAALLARYPDRELLVSGHTALAGSKASRQKLSEERAEAVALFLVSTGARSANNVYTRGFGADKPIAPNDTEEHRARNRRVEITILEK